WPSVPETTRSMAAALTDEKAGSTFWLMTPVRVMSSHPASSSAMGASADAVEIALSRAITVVLLCGCRVVLQHLLAHVEPDTISQVRELRGRHDVLPMAGPVEVDVDDALDPPWPRGHHHDLLGQEDGFLDRMGDEQHGRLLLAPDRQELVLLELAR